MTKTELKEQLSLHSEEIIDSLANTLFIAIGGSLDEIEDKMIKNPGSRVSVEARTIKLLHSFGMSQNLNGFFYIVCAVKILLQDGRPKKLHMGKALYPEIAREFHVTPAKIERSTRTAIKSILDKESGLQVAKYLGYDDVKQISKAGAFLLATAEKIYEQTAQ